MCAFAAIGPRRISSAPHPAALSGVCAKSNSGNIGFLGSHFSATVSVMFLDLYPRWTVPLCALPLLCVASCISEKCTSLGFCQLVRSRSPRYQHRFWHAYFQPLFCAFASDFVPSICLFDNPDRRRRPIKSPIQIRYWCCCCRRHTGKPALPAK